MCHKYTECSPFSGIHIINYTPVGVMKVKQRTLYYLLPMCAAVGHLHMCPLCALYIESTVRTVSR